VSHLIRRFVVTDDHLKLARRMTTDWNSVEFGAPAIDPKRPYGNSDVYGDIAAILGIPTDAEAEDHDDPYTDADYARMLQLHRQMEVVLQIALATGAFEAGAFEAPPYTANWRKAPA
jgi:hypothetical protein